MSIRITVMLPLKVIGLELEPIPAIAVTLAESVSAVGTSESDAHSKVSCCT